MMSQGSKNSAGRNSEAQSTEPVLLFQRQGKPIVKKETQDPVAMTTAGSITPGMIAIRPGLLQSSFHQNSSSANQNGSGDSQTGARNSAKDATAASLPNSQPTKSETSTSDLNNLQQQFQQLHLLNQNLANTKEKTPMCLINELARFNKVQHQYTLVDEQGPPHKKIFFVKLKLGDEEYSSQGASIKKGQHAAASIALHETQLKHPPPKPPRVSAEGAANTTTITPTVELNSLAMKRGEPAVYKPVESRQHPYYPPPNFDFRGMYNQRYHYPRMPRTFCTSLKVGPRMFFGEGQTRQAARHMAANKALKILRYLPIPNQVVTEPKEETIPVEPEQLDAKDQLKSEISLVHEIALKNNVEVVFEVIRESGPPHMKLFVTQCCVGDITTEAQGNSKKLSKKKAAELMLAQLLEKQQVSLTTTTKPKPRMVPNKKKSRNLIKVEPVSSVQKADPSYGVGINPISRLIQIMQAQKKKEPVYTFITERGLPRRREFVMQVCVDDKTCTGTGPNKKLAKRSAAEEMLKLLGFSPPSPQPARPSLKTGNSEVTTPGDKKVTFCDSDETNVNGKSRRQLMPGLLFLPDRHGNGQLNLAGREAGGDNLSNFILGNSDTRPELQLKTLVESQKIQLDFDDFSGKECLCRIMMSNHPGQSVHGTGLTKDAARDAASIEAIKFLLERGSIGGPSLASAEGDMPVHGKGDWLSDKKPGGIPTEIKMTGPYTALRKGSGPQPNVLSLESV